MINMPNFEVNNVSVSTLLGFVSDGTIAIPEIQRPFVWDSTKVRNLDNKQLKKSGKIVNTISIHGFFDDGYRWEVVFLEDGNIAQTERVPENVVLEKFIFESIID